MGFNLIGSQLPIRDLFWRNGFDQPTPIQAQAVPAIMSGRDLIGIAKTGSGKTLAFLLPMFRHITDQPELEEEDGPIGKINTVMYVSPYLEEENGPIGKINTDMYVLNF